MRGEHLTPPFFAPRTMHPLLKHLQQQIPVTATQLCIAFSGGLDSRVLLELAHQLRKQRPELQLHALHVHHGLSVNADAWADFCQDTCMQLGIPLQIHRVKLDTLTGSLENRARLARYRIFEESLQPGAILLQAHHRGDQAETLLLRLLRGAGIHGLSSIPRSRNLGPGSLLRPLLAVPREQLHAFALTQSLQWIEDESNQDTQPDRNFLRLEILPRLNERFTATEQNLSQMAHWASESDQLHRELAELDLQACQGDTPFSLQLTPLLQLASHRRINLLRHWLLARHQPLAGLHHWAEMEQLCTARDDAQPQLGWGEGSQRMEARRFQQQLYIQPAQYFQPWPADWQIDWDGSSPLVTPAGPLALHLHPVNGQPLQQLQARSRQGGETLHLAGRGHRDVKRLLQEKGVPPWQRQQLPFIWQGDTLIAVGDLLVAAGWRQQP